MKVQKKSRTKAKTDSTKISYSNKNKSVVWISALGVALATFLVYLPALNNDFVNWDDDKYVYENNKIGTIDLNFLKWVLTTEVAGLWHPLTMFSYAVDYAFWGLYPFGYHLTNNLLHSLDTLLVFLLTVQLVMKISDGSGLSKALIIAGITSLLFGIHPIHVESVAWVSERKDVLSSFFYLLSLIAYLKYTSSIALKRYILYGACFIFFVLSLLSKPMAVSLPAVLLILDFYPLGRLKIVGDLKRSLTEKLPFVLMSLLFSVITILTHHSRGGLASSEMFPIIGRILVSMYVYIFYLTKIMLPLVLAPFYPYPSEINFFSFEYLGSLISLITITLICIWALKASKLFLAIWLYYIVTLIPVIGIVKVGLQAAADRYTYLPSIGLFLIVGSGVWYCYENFFKKHYMKIIVAMFIVFGILAIKTNKQITIWRDSLTLWSYEVRIFPDSDLPAYLNLCSAYLEVGDYKQALENCDKAIKIDPKDPNAYINRGLVYDSLGDYQAAIADFNKAIDLNPQDAAPYSNLAITYNNLGQLDNAIKALNVALRLQPDDPIVHNNLGNAYFAKGLLDDAVREYLITLTITPDYVDARYNLGLVYISQGRSHEAITEFEAVLKRSPDYVKARQAIEGLLKK